MEGVGVLLGVGVFEGEGVDEGVYVEVGVLVETAPVPDTTTLSIYQPKLAVPLSLAKRKRKMAVCPA